MQHERTYQHYRLNTVLSSNDQFSLTSVDTQTQEAYHLDYNGLYEHAQMYCYLSNGLIDITKTSEAVTIRWRFGTIPNNGTLFLFKKQSNSQSECDNEITYTIKSYDECMKEFTTSRDSINAIFDGLKNHPESFKALGESFWKQYFMDHNVKWNPTSAAKDFRCEFRIQNMLKFYNQLEQQKDCKQCHKHSACAGSDVCLHCKVPTKTYKGEFSSSTFELTSFLSVMPSETVLH